MTATVSFGASNSFEVLGAEPLSQLYDGIDAIGRLARLIEHESVN